MNSARAMKPTIKSIRIMPLIVSSQAAQIDRA
jgi:hypothetical protein